MARLVVELIEIESEAEEAQAFIVVVLEHL